MAGTIKFTTAQLEKLIDHEDLSIAYVAEVMLRHRVLEEFE